MSDPTGRPAEVANSLNPAWCGWLLREAAGGYAGVKPAGMPFALSFLVLPVVLHRRTRDALPRSTATAMHAWLRARPDVLPGFAARAARLAPFVREALLFAGSLGLLSFADGGLLVPAGELRRGKATVLARSQTMKVSVRKAGLVGELLAEAGEPATVFQMWGVRP